MAKKTYAGLNDTKPINIIWGGCPNKSYFVVRNHSFDDTIEVKQTIRKIHTESNIEEVKEITTPIKKGEEQSFYVERAADGLIIQSTLDYSSSADTIPKYCRGATIIVSELPSKGSRSVFQVEIISAKDYNINMTMTEKSEIYFMGKTDRSIHPADAKNELYPDKKESTTDVLLVPSSYQAHTAAGRGYLVESISNIHNTKNILKQTETFDFEIGNKVDNKKDFKSKFKVYEVPYISKFVKTQITEYNENRANAKEPNNFESDDVMADLMFLIEPSQSNDTEFLVTNIQNNSGVTKLGTLRNPDDSSPINYAPSGWEGETNSLLDSRMYKVDENSQAQWYQHLFDVDKIKGFAVTVKTVSQNYPYTLTFAGPLLTGITFNSATQLKVNMRDREAIFNNVEHEGKVIRICAVYGVTFIELYVNGRRVEHETQSNNNISGKEINTIGLDCRTFYQTEREPINLTSRVLGSNRSSTIKVKEDTVNPDNGRVEMNLKTITYQQAKQTDNLPVLIPKLESGGRSNGIIPFGSNVAERKANIYNKFFSMELTGLTAPNRPETDPAYAKDLSFGKTTTSEIKCYATDETILPLIEKSSTNKALNLEAVKIVKGRTQQVELYKSTGTIEGKGGAETTYNISIDQDLFITLPSSDRVVKVEFKNPITGKVQVRLTITITK